jgi:hypothetical protein
MHLFLDINFEQFIPSLACNPAPCTATNLPPNLPARPAQSQYSVVESPLTPNTPLVPVPNPLILSGQPLPPEVPAGLASPLLLTHMGGRLKSVQERQLVRQSAFLANPPRLSLPLFYTGSHTAGTSPLGGNVDTEARQTTESDPWPIWLPYITGGSVADTAIDFVGFAIVVNSVTCSHSISAISGRVTSRTCTALGLLLGDGASMFEDSPLDLRQTLAPLFADQPAEVDGVVQLIDDTIGSVPPLPEVPEVPVAAPTSTGGLGGLIGGLRLR